MLSVELIEIVVVSVAAVRIIVAVIIIAVIVVIVIIVVSVVIIAVIVIVVGLVSFWSWCALVIYKALDFTAAGYWSSAIGAELSAIFYLGSTILTKH